MENQKYKIYIDIKLFLDIFQQNSYRINLNTKIIYAMIDFVIRYVINLKSLEFK